MKILLATPVYQDSFADNVSVTLEDMGHRVILPLQTEHDAYYSFRRRALRAVSDRLLGDRPTAEETAVLKRAKACKPDMILSLTRGLNPEILNELGKICPGRRVLWWGDPPANTTRWGMVDPRWDWVYVKDVAAVAKLRILGRNAHLLHEAMNPRWHRPVATQRNEEIVVAGNSYAYRQAICLELMARKVKLGIYGARPPVWSDPEYKKVHRGKYIVREDKSRVFGEGLACLNSLQMAEGNSLNCRAFEVSGAGGLHLMEYRPIIQECFEPGKEVLTFTSMEELMDHIERARNFPDEARRIREASAKRALSEHTYRHRLERMLSMVLGS